MMFFNHFIQSIKQHKTRSFVLCVILLSAVFLRFYNLPNTVIFQADQARDAILVSRIFMQHKPVFIGPVTSVGNMYLGPLYYYFMLPFLMLSYPSPLGPAYGIAILSVITVYLFYRLGSYFLGEMVGIISALIAAFSTTLIYFSRFSWNPNPVPLVSLLMIFLTYMAWKKSPKYWLGIAVCFSTLLQLHYITLIMLPGAGFFWFLSLFVILKSRTKSQSNVQLMEFLKMTILSVVIVAISFTPLVFFDFRHNWTNVKAFQSIFTSEKILTDKSENKLSDVVFGVFRESHGRTIEVLFTLFFGKVTQFQNFLLGFTGLYLFYFVKCKKKILHWDGQLVVLIYLIISIFGISAYKRSIFDHYLLFIVPMSIWFLASILANLEKYWFGKLLIIVFLAFFGWYNLQNLPLKSQGWTIYKVQEITNEVTPHLKLGEKYDVVLISESGDFYALNYRYFLSTTSTPPIEYDVSQPISTLVIINENQKNKSADMIPVYQIEVFGQPKEVIRIPHVEGPDIEIWRK